MNYKSLANTEKFPSGVGVAINREMMVWGALSESSDAIKSFVTAWDGSAFSFLTETGISRYHHACELPESSENEFVRDGVRYVAVSEHGSGCNPCDLKKDGICRHPKAQYSCSPSERKDGKYIIWKRADKTLEERVEALERTLSEIMQKLN